METVPSNFSELINNQWRVHRIVSVGPNGNFYYARDVHTGNEVFVKHDHRTIEHNTLDNEAEVSKLLETHAPTVLRFPRVHFNGLHGNHRMIVMDRLGRSMRYVHERFMHSLPMHLVLRIGNQAISILETLHGNGLLHRNITPSKLLLGNPDGSHSRKLYMTDFSISDSFLDRHGRHIRSRFSKRIPSDLEFGSISAHKRRNLSRRDDIESLLYTLVFLRKGYLPWSHFVSQVPPPSHEEIIERKAAVSAKELFVGMPQPLFDLWEYFKTLKFSEVPDYQAMREFLNRALFQLGQSDGGKIEL